MSRNPYYEAGFKAGKTASLYQTISAPKNLTKHQRKQWAKGFDAAITTRQ